MVACAIGPAGMSGRVSDVDVSVEDPTVIFVADRVRAPLRRLNSSMDAPSETDRLAMAHAEAALDELLSASGYTPHWQGALKGE